MLFKSMSFPPFASLSKEIHSFMQERGKSKGYSSSIPPSFFLPETPLFLPTLSPILLYLACHSSYATDTFSHSISLSLLHTNTHTFTDLSNFFFLPIEFLNPPTLFLLSLHQLLLLPMHNSLSPPILPLTPFIYQSGFLQPLSQCWFLCWASLTRNTDTHKSQWMKGWRGGMRVPLLVAHDTTKPATKNNQVILSESGGAPTFPCFLLRAISMMSLYVLLRQKLKMIITSQNLG